MPRTHPSSAIAVIDTTSLRLDDAQDRAHLTATVEHIRPRLLILDPLVRLHAVDENVAGDIAPVLAYLRTLQRRFATAVLVVHHARKSGAKRAGQALRGTGELFAWCDSMAYLHRQRKQLLMSVEHRAAPAMESIEVELAAGEDGPALRVKTASRTSAAKTDSDPRMRILAALKAASGPLTLRQIRSHARVRNATVSATLEALCQSGTVTRSADGYSLHTKRPLLDQPSATATASNPWQRTALPTVCQPLSRWHTTSHRSQLSSGYAEPEPRIRS